ncbi:MAG TPA: hypothetical protein VFY72_00210, partial [Beijerinckiaceae bacterium]|nr:hypothetical protein [Beijerinckiaceae bacterium]
MTDNNNKMRAPLFGLICPPALPAGLRLALVALGLAFAAAPFVAPEAQAELVIDVRRGNFQPIPIAVADFAGEGDVGQRVAAIIANNLKRSGYFVPIDKAQFPEKQPAFDAAPRFDAWRGSGVQGLVTGRVSR